MPKVKAGLHVPAAGRPFDLRRGALYPDAVSVLNKVFLAQRQNLVTAAAHQLMRIKIALLDGWIGRPYRIELRS